MSSRDFPSAPSTDEPRQVPPADPGPASRVPETEPLPTPVVLPAPELFVDPPLEVNPFVAWAPCAPSWLPHPNAPAVYASVHAAMCARPPDLAT